MVKVVAISDMHGQLPAVPPCDILVIAGDVAPDYISERYFSSRGTTDTGTQRQAYWLRNEFSAWLKNQEAKHIVGIAGNHDFALEGRAGYALGKSLPWVYLEDSSVELEGLRIYGTPWVPRLPSWAFYASDAALEARGEAIPEGLDILVSHGPPFGAGDRVKGVVFNGCSNVGDSALAVAVVRKKPRVTLCGHIHEGFGHYTRLGPDVYNVSILDEMYEHVNPHTEVYLEPIGQTDQDSAG